MNRSVVVCLRRGPSAAALGALLLAVGATLPAHASTTSGSLLIDNAKSAPVQPSLRVRLVNAALQPPAASVFVEVAPPVPYVHAAPPAAPVARPRRSSPGGHPAARPASQPRAWSIGRVRGSANGFFYGQCTWWVAHKRSVPWRGNAWEWWWAAGARGYAEGWRPHPGAIMVMGYSWSSPWGHVAYVETVYPNGTFLVSEMNWWGVPGGGWGRVDYRVVTSMSGVLGFIY